MPWQLASSFEQNFGAPHGRLELGSPLRLAASAWNSRNKMRKQRGAKQQRIVRVCYRERVDWRCCYPQTWREKVLLHTVFLQACSHRSSFCTSTSNNWLGAPFLFLSCSFFFFLPFYLSEPLSTRSRGFQAFPMNYLQRNRFFPTAQSFPLKPSALA